MRNLLLLAMGTVFINTTVMADKEPDTSHLPQPVQQTINEWKGEGDLKKVKTRRGAQGTVYEVEYKERGDEKQMVIAPDGSVISESSGKNKGKKKDKDKDKGKNKGKDKKRDKDNDDDDEDDDDDNNPVYTPGPVPGTPVPSVTNRNDRISRHPRFPGGILNPNRNPSPNQNPTTPQPRRSTAEDAQFISWEKLPPKVQTVVSEQKELGAAKQIQTQTRKGKTLYHVTYEKGIISYTPEGEIADSNSYWK